VASRRRHLRLRASSMGALRAAELGPFWMVGVGRIFEPTATVCTLDDDELHCCFARRRARTARCPRHGEILVTVAHAVAS